MSKVNIANKHCKYTFSTVSSSLAAQKSMHDPKYSDRRRMTLLESQTLKMQLVLQNVLTDVGVDN